MTKEVCLKCDAFECGAVLPHGSARVDRSQWITVIVYDAEGDDLTKVDLCPDHGKAVLQAANKAAGLIL